MRTVSAILIFTLFIITSVFPQGEIDDQKKIFYRNERTFAATLNSNGYGGNFRYAKRLDGFRKSTYEIDLFYVKHEKEAKITIYSSQQLGNSFVFGKLNSFFTLHVGIGLQKEIFEKHDKGGISIRYFYNFGPTIGILKPIYYEVITDTSGSVVTMKFESHLINIQRKAPFYVGLKEISFVPGAYSKFGFTFEFSKSEKVISAIETGIAIDAFVKKMPIMANNENHWLFFSFFLSYRFGKVIDAQFKNKTTKLDEVLTE
jgi:hypothetical protein